MDVGVILTTTALMAVYGTPIRGGKRRMSESEFRHQFHSASGLAGRKKARKAAKVSKRKNRQK